tara:strand:- start:273 stop:551 length:279 start_codon:yes stop_codon:yes gene_type:complete
MEAKIYEFHGNFGMCIVCAKNKDHAQEVIADFYKEDIDESLMFSEGQEIPDILYDVMTMEVETEKGTDMIFFSQYMAQRKENQFEILTSLTA